MRVSEFETDDDHRDDELETPRPIHEVESPEQGHRRRNSTRCRVDFTLMYVAHDAFNRDLARLRSAVNAGQGFTDQAVATWQLFRTQLHIHHTAEDECLWPALRAAAGKPAESQILDDMEVEHASLDPRIAVIDAAFEAKDPARLGVGLTALAEDLAAHMRHEEDEALPLLDRLLGQSGWDAFGERIRHQQGGMTGAAQYLPWVLDEANPQYTAQVLRMLPAPVRMLYRRRWEPRYRKACRMQ